MKMNSKKNALLLIIVAKLKFVDFTEQVRSITHFVSCVSSGMGCTTVALHPQRLGLSFVPLPCLVIPLRALYLSL